MNRWEKARRTLLKQLGLGSALLPLLSATRPLQAAEKAPRRLIVVVQTNGLPIDTWRNVSSTTNLAQAKLPDLLTPLKDFYQDLIILPELTNPAYEGAGHGAYGTLFSPGPNRSAPEYWTPQTATLDQICASAVAKTANLTMGSLNLQVQPDASENVLGAYRCFFRGDNQPMTPETSPYKVAERLFAGGSMPSAALEKVRAERRSMLDFVKGDLQRFAANLGREDRSNIESHLQAVRDIENQLTAPVPSEACGPLNQGQPLDLKANDNYPALLKLDLELAAAALRCDSTRVVTLTLANAYGSDLTFSWLGIEGTGLEYPTRAWHDVAHREMRGDVNDKLAVDKWYMGQFAHLLKVLKNTPEAGGNMLDNSIVLWANHMENGANHDAHKLPWIIAGKGGGYLKTNQLLKPAERISKVRVMCEIANAMGANVPFLGSQTYGGPLSEIRAS